jgi:DNA-binding transcriptional LysR family regulator
MELRHLRYFVALADNLHFGKTAASLGIAQPSLSHQIRQLEEELQLKLFERTNRRVRLTDPGRLFLVEARAVLALANRAAVLARRTSLGETGTLRIGLAGWIDSSAIAAIVERFHERMPAIRVELQSMPSPLQMAAVRDGELDIAFVQPSVPERSLASELLSAEPLVVALPDSHPLVSRRRILLSWLAEDSFLLFPPKRAPLFHDLTLKLCKEAGFVPHVRHEADEPRMLLGLVAMGLGISLVPESALRMEWPGVVFRALHPSPPVLETALVWRRDPTSLIIEGFLLAFHEHRGLSLPWTPRRR